MNRNICKIIYLIILLSAAVCSTAAENGNMLYIHQINTGEMVQEAFLLCAPDMSVTLIDSCFPQEVEKVLFPALRQRNITCIDRVIISHPHDDHMGGIPALLRNPEFTVGEILWSPLPAEAMSEYDSGDAPVSARLQEEIMAEATARNIPVKELHAGDRIDLGGNVFINILITADPIRPCVNFINNHSVVFMLEYGNFRMLFTGDMGFEEEKVLMETAPDLQCHILKVGHHAGAGSSSEDFLQKTGCKAAIASMPFWLSNDPRGQRVEELLKALNIPLLRCWEYPDIIIAVDGENYTITYRKTVDL